MYDKNMDNSENVENTQNNGEKDLLKEAKSILKKIKENILLLMFFLVH